MRLLPRNNFVEEIPVSIIEIVTIAKDVLIGIAAATTAVIAVIGLRSWKRELQGKADFDVARSFIRATYRLRNEIQNARSPFISAYEFPDDYNAIQPSSPDKEAQAWAYIYKNRWTPVWGAIQEFDSHTLEAEALWGSDIRPRADALRQCANEFRAAMDAVIWDKQNGGQDFASDKEFAQTMRRSVAAAPGDEQNDLSKKIASAVGAIEEQVRPHLSRG